MKKSILIMALFALTTTVITTSCDSSADKLDKAENAVIEADEELERANQEYLEDVENYKKATAAKIAANQKSIDDFNKRIADQKESTRADYKKKIAELDNKNSDMQKKLDDYTENGKENWETFKAEFSRDMDELGQAIKQFFN